MLEKRYLLCQQWRQIASDMKVTVRWAQMLRDGAIQELQRVLDRKEE